MLLSNKPQDLLHNQKYHEGVPLIHFLFCLTPKFIITDISKAYFWAELGIDIAKVR